MNLSTISVVVTTFNEAATIGRCLDSAAGFGEVLVVDSFSSDETVAAARRRSTVVYQRPYVSPSEQKNWAAARARSEWILVLDADEVVSDRLRAEIAALDPGGRTGFWIRRRSVYLGRTIRGCGWQRDKVLRLYDRRRASYPPARVHEEVEAAGPVGRLDSTLAHTPYRGVEHHLEKIDAYTSRGAVQYVERGGRLELVNMVLHPPFRFVRMYLLQRGFLDGYAGLVLCLLSSFSVFLKYSKAWELKRNR